MPKAASTEDLHNIEAWAGVITDMLGLMPLEQRAAVLAAASKAEKAKSTERAKHPHGFIPSAELADTGHCHYGAIMRLKALLVQVFVRDITNDHSAEDAAALLFAKQPHGHGSGCLLDYLEGLESLGAERRSKIEKP